MAITYTEIEQEKNMRIVAFFAVVLLFYFLIAVILASLVKAFMLSGFFISDLRAENAYDRFLTPKQLIYVLIFAFVAAVIHILYSISNATDFIKSGLGATNIDTLDSYHSRFKTIVDELNVATGSKYNITPIVIPTLAMNAFAVCDSKKNAMLGVTEGLLYKLNRQQLEAVVAHEAGHIVSGDSFQTTVACSLFGVYAAMLNALTKAFGEGRVRVSGRGGGGIIILLLAVYIILGIAQFFYNIIRLFVSRDRELRADAIAVRLTRDPISLAESLYAISRGWRGFGYVEPALESVFIMNPVKEEVDETEGFWADLFSTHPPVNKRMAVLADMAHEGVENIQRSVLAQEDMRQKTKRLNEEKKEEPRWMVRDGKGEWSGPFDISQIMLLGWLTPDTWIKPLGGDEKKAKDEEVLKVVFNEKFGIVQKSSLKCPKCAQYLAAENYEGAQVYHCLFCGGFLVEEGKIPRIIIREEKAFDERIQRLAELTQKDGVRRLALKDKERMEGLSKCPKCGGTLIKGFFNPAYFVEVERCLSCNSVWFDKDEIDVLQYLIEKKKTGY